MLRDSRRLAGLAAFVFLILPVAAQEEHRAAIEQATGNAQIWLALIDDGKYGAGWDAASIYLRNSVTKEQFEQQVAAARQPLGKVLSRKLRSARYTTSLPGAPDGQYVLLKYQTSFESKKSAVETITPMLEKDGTWRVSGYFIK